MSAAARERRNQRGPEHDPIQALANQTVAGVFDVIKACEQNYGKQAEPLQNAITRYLHDPFGKLATPEAKHKLYLKISTSLHPDKLNESYPEVASYLGTFNALNIPFQCAEGFKSKPIEKTESATAWLFKVGQHIAVINTLNTTIGDPQNGMSEDQKFNTRKQLEAEKAELKRIFPGLFLTYDLFVESNRYFQPLKLLTDLIIWPLTIGLAIAWILSLSAISLVGGIAQLPFKLFKKVLNPLVNLVIGKEYNSRHREESYRIAIKLNRALNPVLAQELSDREVLSQTVLPALNDNNFEAVMEEYKDLVVKDTLIQNSIGPFTFLRWSLGALGHSLTHPPKGAGGIFLWAVTWPLRLTFGLALIISNLAVRCIEDAIDLISLALSAALTIACFAVEMSVLFVLNLPLYVLVDFPRAVGRAISSMNKQPKNAGNQDTDALIQLVPGDATPSSAIGSAGPERSRVVPSKQQNASHGQTPSPKPGSDEMDGVD